MRSQFHESSTDYVRLTALGYEHQSKQAILGRFRSDLQLAKEMAARMREDFGEIWVEHLLPPVSYDPLTKEEEMAISTGHFTSFQKRPQQQSGAEGVTGRGGNPHHTRASTNPGVSVRGTGGAARHQHPRSFGEGNFSGSLEKGARFERDYPHSLDSVTSSIDTAVANAGRDRHGGKEEDETEETLWSMPVADGHLGTFDDKGNFTMNSPPSSSHRQNPELGTPLRGDLSHIPGHDRLPPPTAARSLLSDSGRSLGAPFAMDPLDEEGGSSSLVNEGTRWFYRDPSGQMQGPFPTEKMLHWYNRKYFPETLPLRREQDVIFEPLSIWRIKCGGSCPFELDTISQHRPNADAGRTSSETIAASSPTLAVGESDIAANTSNNTANILAKLGISWSATTAPTVTTPMTTAKAKMVVAAETSSTKSMMMPPVPAPPSTTGKSPTLGLDSQKTLAQDELNFLQNLRSNAKKMSNSMEGSMASLSLREGGGHGNGDGDSDGNDKSRRPHSHQEPPSVAPIDMPIAPRVSVPSSSAINVTTFKPIPPPLEMKPAIPPSVGWAKIRQAPVAKSLDEIIKEEEAQAATRHQLASTGTGAGGAPRSFAEMFRGSTSSTSGNGSSPNPATIVKSPGGSVTGGKTNTANRSSSVAISPASATSLPSSTGTVKAWCLSQLKPLEATYDIQMCTILLMELKTPQEVMGFIEDNLKSNKMNLRAFSRGLIERRFGPDMSLPSAERPMETEFVTVERKSRGKKSQ